MSQYPKQFVLWSVAAACITWAGCAGATGGSWEPLGPTETFEGKSRATLASEWGRWAYANTGCDSPDVDDDGSLCALYQPADSDVFFLAGGALGTKRTKCIVPAGKAIVVPLFSYLLDNAGVAETSQLSRDELVNECEEILSSVTDLHLRINGVEVSRLAAYAVEPTEFSYEVPPEPNWYSCNHIPDVTGRVAPAFVTGHFVILPPPVEGVHELEYGGVGYLHPDPLLQVEKTVVEVQVKTRFRVAAE